MLTGAEILAARDRRTKVVAVPEWGGQVLIGTMGALDAVRMVDWLDGLEQAPADPDRDKEEPVTVMTTDSPGGKPEVLDDDDAAAKAPEASPAKPRRKLTACEHMELRLRYLTASILDPQTHQPAFDRSQIEQLGQKNHRVLTRLYDEILALHAQDDAELGAFEKNSGGTSTGGSGGD
jgi:hypothetical protein